MKIEYDPKADALYIQFQSSGQVDRSVKVQEGIVIDLAQDGRVFGIEILDVSHRIPAAELRHLDSNLPLSPAR